MERGQPASHCRAQRCRRANGKDTYLLRTPSDVEYSESDPMLAEAYQSLIAQQDLIISHIYATGQTVIPPNE